MLTDPQPLDRIWRLAYGPAVSNRKKAERSKSASDSFTGGTFPPPQGYEPTDIWPDSPPPSDEWKNPIAFKITEPLPTETPLRSLRHVLLRHRLLFLWAATPVHDELVPGDPQTDKAKVFERIGRMEPSMPANRPAEDVFLYEHHLDEWLTDLQRHLGRGIKGKWATPNSWPHEFPRWHLGANAETALHDSLTLVQRLVGSVLNSRLPRWLDDEDLLLVRACARAAEPTSFGEPRSSWEYMSLVLWDYPDLVATAGAALDRLVALEQAPQWDPNRDTVELDGPGLPPILLGRKRQLLTDLQYQIVSRLIEASPNGISKDELLKIGLGGWVALDKLRKSDPDWATVLPKPGVAWKGYRILLRLPSR